MGSAEEGEDDDDDEEGEGTVGVGGWLGVGLVGSE